MARVVSIVWIWWISRPPISAMRHSCCSHPSARAAAHRECCAAGHIVETAANNHLFVETVLYRVTVPEFPSTICPPGPETGRTPTGGYAQVRKRHDQRVFQHLATDCDTPYMMINNTIIRAHQHSEGTNKKGARIRLLDDAGNLTSKIHASIDGAGKSWQFLWRKDKGPISLKQSHCSMKSPQGPHR